MLNNRSFLVLVLNLGLGLILIFHGGFHGMTYEAFHQYLEHSNSQTEIFHSPVFMYLMMLKPFGEVLLGFLILLNIERRKALYACFVWMMFAMYFFLDAWRIGPLLFNFFLALGAILLINTKYKPAYAWRCMILNVPTLGMIKRQDPKPTP